MYDINILENPTIDDSILDFDISFDMHYEYNGVAVPRGSHILSACRDQESLISWAAGIPEYLYKNIKNKALTVGTEVHHKIDNYLYYTFGKSNIEDIENLEPQKDSYQEEIDTAYYNFKEWHRGLHNNGFIIEEVVGLEIPVVCPWYGGTIDAIFKINGLYYIIDFKTSKSISYQYPIQTAAYMWIINSGYCKDLPHIDGIGIIRVDKRYSGGFEDLFMNVYNPNQAYLINQYQMVFCSYVDSYYRSIHTNGLTRDYKESYNINNIGVKENGE